MSRNLKIVSVSSEVYPFSKTGGLGLVANELPRAISKLGHDVTIITPFYEAVIDKDKYNLETILSNIKVELSDGISTHFNVLQGKINGKVPVFFIKHEKYFSRNKNLYGSKYENARFMLFSLAALKLIEIINLKPDIIHCHDWQTGLIPYFIANRFKKNKKLKDIATLYTIHNLAFQLGHNWWEIKSEKRDSGYGKLPNFREPKLELINFAKRALISSNIINTVSEQYAEEILTKDYGEDLHRILKNRQDRLYGIINGIDYNEYNPATDPGLKKKYSVNSLYNKKINKEHLQKTHKLPIRPNVPIICSTSRIAEQKGFEIILKVLDDILRLDLQFIITGDGDKGITRLLKKYSKKYPKKFVLKQPFEHKKETSYYAGCDMILLASRFEPCGVNQQISSRYGCIPIVHSIGGLSDTIDNYNPRTKKGNGFNFKRYNSKDLLVSIVRATENYKFTDNWQELMNNAMTTSFSWKLPAKKYILLYKKAIKHKLWQKSHG